MKWLKNSNYENEYILEIAIAPQIASCKIAMLLGNYEDADIFDRSESADSSL